MKMEEQNNFQAEIKILHKKFRILDRPNTKILYEFCQFDAVRTYKVLSLAQTMRNPGAIIQMLIKNPQRSEEYIDSFISRYDKQIGQQIDLFVQKNQTIKTKQKIQILEFEFFKYIPQDTIGTIMSFLDPYSFKLFTYTNNVIYKIGKAQALSELYKQICKVLFPTNQPRLPKKCRFQTIKQFVQSHPQQYYPYYQNFKNAVNNNLRHYIWKHEPKDFKLDSYYYKSFGSYQSLFQKCPRVNFNGYYMCKHKYVKIGQKDMVHVITPIHIIYYFRYLRFLEDGSVVYYVNFCDIKVANRKIKDQDIMKHLSKQKLQQKPMMGIIGEFMQHKQVLYIKTCKQNSVFCYDFQIRSTEGRICNELSVLEYKLELIDKSYITQTLYKSGPHKQELLFNYVYNEEIKKENSLRIQACSL